MNTLLPATTAGIATDLSLVSVSPQAAGCCGGGKGGEKPDPAVPSIGPLNRPMRATMHNPGSGDDSVTKADSSDTVPPGTHDAKFGGHDGTMAPQPGELASHDSANGGTGTKPSNCPPPYYGVGGGGGEAPDTSPQQRSGGFPDKSNNLVKPGLVETVPGEHHGSGGISPSPMLTDLSTNKPTAPSPRFSAALGLMADQRTSAGILLPKLSSTEGPARIGHYEIRSGAASNDEAYGTSPKTWTITTAEGDVTRLEEIPSSSPTLKVTFCKEGSAVHQITTITELTTGVPTGYSKGYDFVQQYPGIPSSTSTTRIWVSAPGASTARTMLIDASGVEHTTTSTVNAGGTPIKRTAVYQRKEAGTITSHTIDEYTIIGGEELLTSSKIALDGAGTEVLTTTYIYWNVPGSPNHKRLQSEQRWDGSWTVHALSENGAVHYTITPWASTSISHLGLAPAMPISSLLSAAASTTHPYRLESQTYTNGASGVVDGTPDVNVVKVAGQEIYRKQINHGTGFYETTINGSGHKQISWIPLWSNMGKKTYATGRLNGAPQITDFDVPSGNFIGYTHTFNEESDTNNTRTATTITKKDSNSAETHKTVSVSRRSDGRRESARRYLDNSLIEVEISSYDALDRILARHVNGFEREAWAYPAATSGTAGAVSAVTHRAEDGSRRTTEYDARQRPVWEKRHGSASTTAFGVTLPAQPDIIMRWLYTPRSDGKTGQVVTTQVEAGGVVRSTVETFDGAGRRSSLVNPDASQRSWTYAVNGSGVYTVTAYASVGGSGTVIETSGRNRDGSPAFSGPVPARNYVHSVAGAFRTATDENGPGAVKVRRVETDGLGRTVRDEHLQSVVGGAPVYEDSLHVYDQNYELESRSRRAPSGGIIYDVWKRSYVNGALVVESGTSVNATWDTGDQNLRKVVSLSSVDASIPALEVGNDSVAFAWRTTSTFMPVAAASTAWEMTAATVRKVPLAQRSVTSWSGHLADSFPQSWTNDGGTIYTEAETLSLSGGVLSRQWQLRRGSIAPGIFRRSIGRDGIDYVFSSQDAGNTTLPHNAFREPLAEFSWKTIPHWPKLERNNTGQVAARLLPNSSIYTDKYTYYTGSGDHRAGRLRSAQTWTYPSGGAGMALGTTYYHYNPQGEMLAVWGNGSPTSLHTYDTEGRMTHLRTYRSAPILPVPDNLITLETALAAAATAATVQPTQWIYFNVPALTLVSSKKYAGQANGVDYTCNHDGSLATRTWLRTDGTNRLRTRYSYTVFGQLSNIQYGSTAVTTYPVGNPNHTPLVYFAYDRAGRMRYRSDASGATKLEYRYDDSLLNELAVESPMDGANIAAAGKHLRRTVDGYGRLSMLEAAWGNALGVPNFTGSYQYSPYVTYNYGLADRLTSLSSAGIQGVVLRSSTQEYLSVSTTSSSYPAYGAFSSILRNSYGQPVTHDSSFIITYGAGNTVPYSISSTPFTWDSNRLATRGEGDTTWKYGYNSKGEVEGVFKTFVSHPSVTQKGSQTYHYYDNIGNRISIEEGPNKRETHYTTNDLNQYTSITRPVLTADIMGKRTGSQQISVNGVTLGPSDYQPTSSGLYFHKEIANTPGPQQAGDTIEPVYVTAGGSPITPDQGAFASVGATSFAPSHDLDGNLLNDGRWTYTWDGENRLIKMEAPAWTQPAAGYQSPAPGGNSLAAMTIEFAYDGLSRRISKKTSMTGTPTKMEGYLYDGWNVVMIAELNPANGAHIKRKWSCLWKPDVGSSMHARASWQAAGGVGGLAWMQTGIAQMYYPPYYYSDAEIHVPMTDHMGNIRHYYQIKSAAGSLTGQVSANFEYDAFGREVRAWGAATGAFPPPGLPPHKPFTDELPFHFSSKFTDQESGLNYYGYRFYSPDLGRWLNRDPIEELGGANLYDISQNNLMNNLDILGLWSPAAHDVLIDDALSDHVETADRDILKESSRDFDKRTQDKGLSPQHYMRNTNLQTSQRAKELLKKFIKRKLDEIMRKRCNCITIYKGLPNIAEQERRDALKELGELMHPLMDSSSPMHRDTNGDPRHWDGVLSRGALGHSPMDNIGRETSKHITDKIKRFNKNLLRRAYFWAMMADCSTTNTEFAAQLLVNQAGWNGRYFP